MNESRQKTQVQYQTKNPRHFLPLATSTFEVKQPLSTCNPNSHKTPINHCGYSITHITIQENEEIRAQGITPPGYAASHEARNIKGIGECRKTGKVEEQQKTHLLF
jgi:hypothetical protein